MTRPFAQLSPIAQAGCDGGMPYSAVAGAVIRQALQDATAGSRTAYLWLRDGDQAARWAQLLGGDGYFAAALDDLARQYRSWR